MSKSIFTKSPGFAVTTCCVILFVFTGCVAEPIDVKDAEILTPMAIPSGKKAKPVQLKRVITKIKRGTVIGSIQAGMLCLPGGEITWKGGRGFVDINELNEVFRDEFENANYTVVGDPDSLFDDSSSWQAEYLIGAIITDIEVSLCSQLGGTKGDVYLEVNWQVYSRLDRKVVFKTTTEGSYKVIEPSSHAVMDLYVYAFGMATQNLLADQKFYALLTGEMEIAAHSPTSFNTLILARRTPYNRPIEHTINDVRIGVVTVFAGEGHGSGFFIDSDGHMLTSAHVVGGTKFVKIKLVTGREILGEVLRKDQRMDIALVKTGEKNMVPLPINKQELNIGAPVCAIGSPLSQELSSTVTRGIISAYRSVEGMTFIQSDVNVLPGNSGCPLVDQNGNAVGVCVRGVFAGMAGLNFFVPVNQALNALNVQMVPQEEVESKRLLAAKEAASKPREIIDKPTSEVKATPTVSEEKVSASLLITCTNEKSIVYIRQGGKWKNKGKPPCYMKNISPGSYTIKAEGTDPWGYDQVYEETVRVHLGEAVTVSIKLDSLKQDISGGIGGRKNTAEIKRSKITADSASGAQVAAIPKVHFNKKEPWTGIWKIEGSSEWELKQHGNKVVSINMASNIKGRVEANRLKGRLVYLNNVYRFDIKISSDGMSFEGKKDCPVNRTCIIKGTRKK